MKRHINLSIEPGLVEKVDKDRGLIKRSNYIEDILKEKYKMK